MESQARHKSGNGARLMTLLAALAVTTAFLVGCPDLEGLQDVLGSAAEPGVSEGDRPADFGPQGPQGEQGPAGPEGDEGPQGPQGLQGEEGPQGDDGPDGPQGEQGLQGLQGDVGPEGEQGEEGHQGDDGQEGRKGDKGDKGDPGEPGADCEDCDDRFVNEGQADSVSTAMLQDAAVTLEKIDTAGADANQIMKFIQGQGLVWADDETNGDGVDCWELEGNAGTTPGTNFLGTTDNQALELRVNSARALRIEPASTPSIIGGHADNTVEGASGATISGGGYASYPNRATADSATVGGGDGNVASGNSSTIAGGSRNTATNAYAFVGGGTENTAIGAAVAGGTRNRAENSSFVGAGVDNTATGSRAFVGAGVANQATGPKAAIAGGSNNIASGDNSFVGGGKDNVASGTYATVAGGYGNTAEGLRSFAAGRSAHAAHDYTFVWSTSAISTIASHTFIINGVDGVGINTNDPQGFILACNGAAAKPGGGSWSSLSDQRLKKHINTMDGALESMLRLRGVTFEYIDPEAINEAQGIRLGMVAQEVEDVFPQWVDERPDGYKYLTFSGFEALAVEALRELRAEKDAQIAAQEEQIDRLEARLKALEALIKQR